jgi:N-acetylmuramoyl-L-alanine amidase
MKIAVNGGHCPGLDNGAIGASGLHEAVVVCDIMKKVAQYLRAVGYQVLEIQENVVGQILQSANDFGSDLFVAIHCDSAENIFAQGTETFCYEFGGEAEKLARCIQSQIITNLGSVDRGIKKANLEVLKETICPSVLIEVGFISNSYDEIMLANPVKRNQFAAAIARGITDYCAKFSSSD